MGRMTAERQLQELQVRRRGPEERAHCSRGHSPEMNRDWAQIQEPPRFLRSFRVILTCEQDAAAAFRLPEAPCRKICLAMFSLRSNSSNCTVVVVRACRAANFCVYSASTLHCKLQANVTLCDFAPMGLQILVENPSVSPHMPTHC